MAVQNLHIKKIRVENYKSLKESEIELNEGLNIIIGKNGAGKSNLLEFLKKHAVSFPQNLIKAISSNYSISYGYTSHSGSHFLSYDIERKKVTSNKHIQYTYELNLVKSSDEKNQSKKEKMIFYGTQLNDLIFFTNKNLLDKEFNLFANVQSGYVSFTIPQMGIWISNSGKMIIDKEDETPTPVDEYSDFSFLAEIQLKLDIGVFQGTIQLKGIDSNEIKYKIESLLANYIDNTYINNILEQYTVIKAIRFNPNLNVYQTEERITIENLIIEFLINDNWLSWSFLSDGTKRMFYLISETLSLEEGILLVEEPELGIHPHQLYKIMDFLKEQSRNKQIIISTHSPLVLDALNQDELDRIIIAKYENGTKFTHLTEEQISKAKRYMNEVGELSYYWLHSDLEQ